MAPTPKFIETDYPTRAEYEASLKASPSCSSAKAEGMSGSSLPTLGYWKIRGLAAPLRMMLYHKRQSFTLKEYGADAKEEWFAKDKPELRKRNGLINLPYIIDGDTVVTQSNSCMLYLGRKLGIDRDEFFVRNHQVLDQTMDLRNDLMKSKLTASRASP